MTRQYGLGTWPSPSANTRIVTTLLSWAESVRSTADRKGGAAVTSASEGEYGRPEEGLKKCLKNGPKLTFKSQSLAVNGSVAVTTWKPGTNPQ